MPEISRFFGISIYFHFRDHGPPHFHAAHGEYETSVNIETGFFEGEFPGRAKRNVLKWLELNREKLREDWRLSQRSLPPNRIAPLE